MRERVYAGRRSSGHIHTHTHTHTHSARTHARTDARAHTHTHTTLNLAAVVVHDGGGQKKLDKVLPALQLFAITHYCE